MCFMYQRKLIHQQNNFKFRRVESILDTYRPQSTNKNNWNYTNIWANYNIFPKPVFFRHFVDNSHTRSPAFGENSLWNVFMCLCLCHFYYQKNTTTNAIHQSRCFVLSPARNSCSERLPRWITHDTRSFSDGSWGTVPMILLVDFCPDESIICMCKLMRTIHWVFGVDLSTRKPWEISPGFQIRWVLHKGISGYHMQYFSNDIGFHVSPRDFLQKGYILHPPKNKSNKISTKTKAIRNLQEIGNQDLKFLEFLGVSKKDWLRYPHSQ